MNIGHLYQSHLLRLCERYVFRPSTGSSWVSHFDVDEFLLVHAPPSTSLIHPPDLPIPISSLTKAKRRTVEKEGRYSNGYIWPIDKRFEELEKKQVRCVVMHRNQFVNDGIWGDELPTSSSGKSVEGLGMVTQQQTRRESLVLGVGGGKRGFGKVSLRFRRVLSLRLI